MEEGAGVPQCQPLPGPGGLRETGVPSCPSPPTPSEPGVALPAAAGAALPTSDGGRVGCARLQRSPENGTGTGIAFHKHLRTIPERHQSSSKAWAPTNHPGDGK